jgi:hypothetical protein
MELTAQLANKWYEHSGGSKPGSNWIGFFEEENGYRLRVSCMFDWSTEERVDVSFGLSREEFLALVDGLREKGEAALSKRQGQESLGFEWRILHGLLQFRLHGRGLAPSGGYVGYHIVDFQDIVSDSSLD